MHQIIIFKASGFAQIDRLDGEVNDWIARRRDIEVISVTPSMCSVAGDAVGELYQFMTITVVYRAKD